MCRPRGTWKIQVLTYRIPRLVECYLNTFRGWRTRWVYLDFPCQTDANLELDGDDDGDDWTVLLLESLLLLLLLLSRPSADCRVEWRQRHRSLGVCEKATSPSPLSTLSRQYYVEHVGFKPFGGFQERYGHTHGEGEKFLASPITNFCKLWKWCVFSCPPACVVYVQQALLGMRHRPNYGRNGSILYVTLSDIHSTSKYTDIHFRFSVDYVDMALRLPIHLTWFSNL